MTACEIVGIDNAREIYEAARHPKSFVALDGADHLLTSARDSTFAASIIAAWATRHALDADTATSANHGEGGAPSMPPPHGSVVVASSPRGPFTQSVTAGTHRLIADEPLPIGNDAGLSPYDLVLAGLGACTSMTMRMYADRKGIPLESVSVTLRHERIHAADCADCETTTRLLDHIEREITMTGDLAPDQVESLRRIADKCPVHQTLTGTVHVTTTLR